MLTLARFMGIVVLQIAEDTDVVDFMFYSIRLSLYYGIT